ncbi:hypothetical protein HanIR_Chr01g0007431 [Helianthus annuus]|nr:hypothetical protein HanIR_Chr01g0007431 [Helianthus annuus]
MIDEVLIRKLHQKHTQKVCWSTRSGKKKGKTPQSLKFTNSFKLKEKSSPKLVYKLK